jgi:hypothetical protein
VEWPEDSSNSSFNHFLVIFYIHVTLIISCALMRPCSAKHRHSGQMVFCVTCFIHVNNWRPSLLYFGMHLRQETLCAQMSDASLFRLLASKPWGVWTLSWSWNTKYSKCTAYFNLVRTYFVCPWCRTNSLSCEPQIQRKLTDVSFRDFLTSILWGAALEWNAS